MQQAFRRRDGTMPLYPGMMHTQMVVQRKTKTQNSYGEDVIVWVDFVTVWLDWRAVLGRELEAMQQVWAEARFRGRTHYVAGIKREMRGVIGSPAEYFDILDASDPDGKLRELVIVARQLVE